MGWMDEYNALEKKRKKEVEKSKAPFMESYQYLKTKRTGNELNDQQPVDLDGIYYEDNIRPEDNLRIPYQSLDQYDNPLSKAVAGYGNVLAAIVNNSKPVDTSDRSWFESGPFLDGYDLFDVSKAIIGTAADVKDDVVEGIVGMAEPTMDAILYGGGFLLDKAGSLIFGKKNWNDQWALDRAMNGKGFFTSENGDSSFQQSLSEVISKDIINEEPVTKVLGFDALKALGIDHEDYSVLGNKSDSLVQSGGQLATTYGLNALGIPWFVTSGITSFGSELENAVKQGASLDEAGTSAAFAAASEIIAEKIFDGFSFGGKTIADVTLKPLIDKISNKFVRTLFKFGVDIAGEGVEDILSGYGSAIGQKLTYADEKDLNELFSKEDRLDAFIGGIIMSLGVNSLALGKSIKNGVDYVSGMTADEEAVVNKETENRIAALEEDGTELKASEKRNIKELVKSFLDKGSISTDTIEEVLGGETYKTYKDTVDSEDAQIKQLEDQIKELGDAPNTVGNSKKFDALQQQLDELKNNSKRTQLKSHLSEEVFSRVKNSRLVESYNENGRRSQAYQADLTKYDEKQRETIQRAIDSGILNNTNRTHEFVDMVAKVSADKGVLFDFTNNEKLKGSVFAVDGKTVNGYFDKQNGTVGVNIDSAKALNTVVGHEITHVLEGTELYDAMKETLFEYAKNKGDYQSRYDALVELYKDVKDADIEAELAADLVGDYLFTDADFINHLSTKNRNVFQKIYDELMYLYNVATAGSKEAIQLEKVKKAFEKAYRESGKAAADTKYSISETTDGRLVAVVDNDILSNIDTSRWDKSTKKEVKKAANEELKKFAGGFTINGIEFVGNKDSRDEYTRSNYSEALARKNPTAYLDKMRATDVLDDVIQVATEWKNDNELTHDRDDYVDFVRGKTLIMSGDRAYSAVVLAGVTSDGKAIFHDVEDIYPTSFELKKTEPSTAVSATNSPNAILEDSDAPNVAQKSGDVKAKYSISDSDGKQLSGEKINRVTEDGLTMTYVRVPNQNTQNYGSTYGQNIEPAGEYMSMDTMQGKYKIDGYEYGTIQFKKPLVLEHSNTSDTGWKKTVSDMYNGLTGKKLTEALIKDGYDAIVTYDDYGYNEIVNLNGEKLSDQGVRFSLSEEVDKNYLDAVNRGDTETAQRIVAEVAKTAMPDSKLRTPDGNLRIVYHGTNTGDFTVFNPDYIGMSSGDDGFFGMGFYFAYSKGEASYYGASRVIPAYLDLKNPFDFEKELQTYKGKKASGGYAPDAVALMNFADKFPEIAKNVTIGVVESGSDTGKQISLLEFSKAFKEVINNKAFEYSEVENEFGEKETVVTADPKTIEYEYNGEKHSYKDYGFQKRFWGTPNELDVAYEYLANSVFEYVDMIPRTRLILDNNREFTAALKKMGYDGAIQSEHGDEAVVFDPAQIKSAEPVTYDDNGNVIPLSERFNQDKKDIRYSLSEIGEQPKRHGNYNVSGKDIALETAPVTEDVAPVQETKTLVKTEQKSSLSDNLSPFQAQVLNTMVSNIKREAEKNNISLRQFYDETAEINAFSPTKDDANKIADSLVPIVDQLDNENFYGYLDEMRSYAAAPIDENIAPVKENLTTKTETVAPVAEETELFPDAPFDQSAVSKLHELNQQKEAFDALMANADQIAPPVTDEPASFSGGDVAPVLGSKIKAVDPHQSVGAAPYGFDPVTQLQYEYGTIPEGEHPVRDDSLPKSTNGKDKVSLTARTVKGAEATPDGLVDLLDKETVGGRFSYIPIKNSDTVKKAYNDIVKKGWEAARGEWEAKVRNGEVSAEMTAIGALLLNNAAKAGDRTAWLSVLHDYQIMGTNAGQAVQAMRILKTLTPDDSLYMIERSVEQMVEDMKLGTAIVIDKNLKQAYLDAKTDGDRDAARKALAEDVAKQIPSTAMDKWTALRYLNMLGNLRTQGRNIIGNLGMSVTSGVKNTVATTIEAVAEFASGGKFHRTKSLFVSKDLLKAARNDFANVESVALNGGKFNDPNAKSIQFQQEVQDSRKIFKFAPLEMYRRSTNFAMDKGDLVFSKAAYGRALSGYLKANGITETDFSKIDQKTLDDARAYAVEQAQEQTFRDNNWLSNWVSKIGRRKDTPKIGKLVSEGVMPFRKTPANILLRAEEYSPLGLVNSTVKSIQAIKGTGNVTGADVVNSWAKTLTGTGLFAMGMLLNNSGALSGGPDEDDDKEWFEDQYGWQNYSIHIGDHNFTIDFLSPAAMPLLMGAQLNELRQNDGIELKDLETALLSISDPMIEMSMLQGVNDTLENIRYSENNMGQFLVNAGLSYLTQGLTNSFLGQLERSFEGQRMSTYVDKDSDIPAWLQKALGKASAKIPGWDYQQIPYVNAWGETEDIAPLPALVENTLSPSYISQGITDDVYEELNRLNDAQSDINVYPQTPDKTVTFYDADGKLHEDYNLSAEEYVELAELQGSTQKELVEEILSSDQYSELTNREKARAVQLAYQYAREYSRQEVLDADGFSAKWMEKAEDDIVNAIIAHTNDERTFAYDYPEKYKFFEKSGIGYDAYASADEDGKRAYNWAYDNPGKYTMSKAIADDFLTYYGYKQEISAIKKNHVGDGEKDVVTDYINNMDLDYGQKIILYRSMYESKQDKANYNMDIIDYLNSRDDISYSEMETILTELGFKVSSDGIITWD